MKIFKIKIENFRILREFSLDLEDELSLIIGKNNCGKTSIINAIDKFICSKTNQFIYDDFNLNFKQDLFKILKEEQKEEDYTNKGIFLRMFIKYDETDDLSDISNLMLDLDETNNVVILGYEYSINFTKVIELKEKYKLYFDELEEEQKKDIQSTFDEYMKKNYKKYFNIYIKAIKYENETNSINEKNYIDISKENRLIDKILNIEIINAKREVTNNESDKTLSGLSAQYYENSLDPDKENEYTKELKKTLEATDIKLNLVYNDIFKDIVNSVKIAGGIKKGDTNIKVESILQEKNILKGNTIVKYESESGCLLPESYNGLGYLNLISIIFQIEIILNKFSKINIKDAKPSNINLLFIEEPEAHTHPQMQYIFIKNIKRMLKEASNKQGSAFNLQTVITTHSSHIVSESEFEDIKYLSKENANEVISKNLKDLEIEYKKDDDGEETYKFLKQYLTLDRAELFFADKAIFIEGDTERILIPAMLKKIDLSSEDNEILPLCSQNISVVTIGAYAHIFEKFIKFLNIKTLIITDLDSVKINGEKCEVFNNDVIGTSNSSLNFFYKKCIEEYQKINPLKKKIDSLISLDFKDKVFANVNEEWIQQECGKIAVAYQTCENNDRDEKYYSRSFEESFFNLNRNFIIDNKEEFSSLKNKGKIVDTIVPYEFAEDCISKKPTFAIEILLKSQKIKDGKCTNWEIPKYIKEGLEWLRKN